MLFINKRRCLLTDKFVQFLEDIGSFSGSTDTPVLDFRLSLLWVSKLKWIPVCHRLLRFTSDMTPTDLLAARMAAHVQAMVGGQLHMSPDTIVSLSNTLSHSATGTG